MNTLLFESCFAQLVSTVPNSQQLIYLLVSVKLDICSTLYLRSTSVDVKGKLT